MEKQNTKTVNPTFTYQRIARKIGYGTLSSELFRLGETEINEKLDNLSDETEDDIFEFAEQHAEYRGYVESGLTLDVKTTQPIMADDIGTSGLEPMGQIQCGASGFGGPTYAGKAIPQKIMTTSTHQFIKKKKINPEENVVRGSFEKLCSRISEGALQRLRAQNVLSPVVFGRLSNSEIESFNLTGRDLQLVKCLVIQCRVEDQKAAAKSKAKLAMPSNELTDRLPITSKTTLKALKKNDLLDPTRLYLSCSLEQITEVFNKYPSIPESDRKNIVAGMALARYAKSRGTN